MLLKHYLDRGVSKAELSRRFGVNRRTIHNWVDTGQLDRDLAAGARGYSPRPPVAHKLAPYKAIIDARLEAFPKLSAKRLFDEVRAAGYPGCYSRVNDYVRATRPREPVESLVRFETPAGHQGQVDFGTFTLPWGRRHALVIVLGYSRLLWLHFYTRQTMPVLMEGLESAFDRFGGVPEELLFEQMRAVVLSDDRGAGGGLVLNEEFLRFAAHWGFMPRSCRPYRPRPRAKWSARSATSARASSTAARLRMTTISTSRPCAGWRAQPTSAGMPRPGSVLSSASSATSGRCFSPWRTIPIDVSAPGMLRSPRRGDCRQP